ncbi:unnamed protein product [Periconia digitata]|uniref:Uncharacterized protein n=1 Tax=Periconia digitata TaxID=1303443 RepID=A0A9W4UQ94_9PLEO|nr:unnamed protein product [Periconia digitata]
MPSCVFYHLHMYVDTQQIMWPSREGRRCINTHLDLTIHAILLDIFLLTLMGDLTAPNRY